MNLFKMLLAEIGQILAEFGNWIWGSMIPFLYKNWKWTMLFIFSLSTLIAIANGSTWQTVATCASLVIGMIITIANKWEQLLSFLSKKSLQLFLAFVGIISGQGKGGLITASMVGGVILLPIGLSMGGQDGFYLSVISVALVIGAMVVTLNKVANGPGKVFGKK
ncbi:MAG: hypothetical protein K9L31_02470 [Candidatus Pacebacteria bacterium]|nr:hypothetical protein [Candidatus Paceibacterota bacterium]